MSIRVVLVILVLLSAFTAAQATTIAYTASNLPDIVPGEDLWRYDYMVSDRSFLQSEFFDIYFSSALFGTLTAGPAPNADWDVAILQQPEPLNLPPFDRGMFDAFALNDAPSLSGAFSVSFVFLGPGTPGSQEFDIFNANFELVESGNTSVPVPGDIVVPEPSTAALFLFGLVACAFHTRRRTGIPRWVR